MSEGPSTSAKAMEQGEARVSPPKAIVDSSPLQSAMDKNRESLKVKLLVRRSANQLVEQGILPPLKTSPAIHEQKKLLERAKTGDLLKAKIQQRPARQELERRHILESHEGHIDPSLADKYRMLEKAILVDQLNKKILHRPGPLELIEKNILHANEPIERIVKEGLVPFKVSGDEDNLTEQNFLSFEDDSQSSEGDLFQQSQVKQEFPTEVKQEVHAAVELDRPKEIELSSHDKHIFESLPTSSGVINISLVPTNNLISSTSAPISVATFKIHNQNVESINIPPPPPPPKLELITYHVKPVMQSQVKGLLNTQSFLPIQISEAPPMTNVSAILAPSLVQLQTQNTVNQHVSSFLQNNQKFSAPGKDKNRKKCKNKALSKARAIKFHEYKGPPNKGGSSMSSSSSMSLSPASQAAKKAGETNYDLIMQQQCLLEYLEGIYKNPHSVAAKPETETGKFMNKPMVVERSEMSDEREKSVERSKTFSKPHVTIFPSKASNQSSQVSVELCKDTTITDVAKLSKMKVSELKAYLKRVNLPVSGPKPLLIERLKPYLPLKPLEDTASSSNNNSTNDESSSMAEGNEFYSQSLHSVSSAESDMDNMDSYVSKPSSVASSTKDDDIVAEQQRKIEELQRKLQQSQHELEQMKQIKTVDVPPPPPPQQTHQGIIFEPQYQMHSSPISTVFVVDVSSNSDQPQVTLSPAPVLLEAQATNMHEDESPMGGNISASDVLLGQDKAPVMDLTQQQHAKGAEASTSTAGIPMSDITDVLEILLKNGEWPEISEDGKGLSGAFLQNLDSGNDGNMLSTKSFIEDVLSSQNPFGVLSPMNEEQIHVDESIEKILDNVIPANGSSAMLNGGYSNGYSSVSGMDFPMDIEDDALVNTEFNPNLFQNGEFVGKPHVQSHFNPIKIENCDNQFLEGAKPHQDHSSELVKSEYPDEHQKSQSNCTKNGLIGNFDHNLFDTLKNNTINNNNNTSCNDMFLIPQDGKFIKDDSKSLITNLHLSNNYDLFSTGIDSTAMDFESIIPYNDLHSHDSLFQISGFDGSMGRGGSFGTFADHNNSLFSDDTRMSNEGMTCEVDNLLCNL